METRKEEYQDELHQLALDISGIKIKLSGELAEPSRKEFNEQLQNKINRYCEIENMPTWPFNKKRNLTI